MCGVSQEKKEARIILSNQLQETVEQSNQGVTVRLATITCPCGWRRSLMFMYKCLYCDIWYCEFCAEAHFGKTRAEYYSEKED